MQSVQEAVLSSRDDSSLLIRLAATGSLIWVASVILVCTVGQIQIRRYYARPQLPATWRDDDAPHVTIIRPLKGLEPRLYDCLACTFRQNYPKNKIHVRFCVSDRDDVCIPVVTKILKDYPDFDAKLLFEDDDEVLKNEETRMGPNPKIRNVSRAYREAPSDIIWAIDCNIWVASGALGRMTRKLEGHVDAYRWKIVHHLPMVKDIPNTTTASESQALLAAGASADAHIRTSNTSSTAFQQSNERTIWSTGGGRLEEQYLSSMHPKFYVAAYMLGVPAVVGKSVMYRRSHLNALTNGEGIDYFSNNICEDQLMGILMFKNKVPEELAGEKLGRQAICWGDIAIQPMSGMSVREYASRRVRWFRVRKFTEFFPSLVESGTECFFCSLHVAFACTTLPLFERLLGVPPLWTTFWSIWLLSVTIWCAMDWQVYTILHSAASMTIDEYTPSFAQADRRPFKEWLLQWLGRESLAFPIWLYAFYGGSSVEWRGTRFRVGMDSRVHEIKSTTESDLGNGHAFASHGKARSD